MFAAMPDHVNNPEYGFCRDCMVPQSGKTRRCSHCGGPRMARHTELYELSIAHIDCDAFYASVEKRDNPALRDKPLIIGGGRRGVVSTACYLARIKGVHSAMPMFKALEACPEATVVKPNMEKYAAVSREVREMMRSLTPMVEPISIDEAFLDLSGTDRLHRDPPARVLAGFVREVETEIGITVSVGLSYCKFLAKVASDFEKPRGFSVIGRAEAKSFLSDKPVGMIWGVGKASEKALARDGIRSIGQLQAMELDTLMKAYGTMGDRLYHLSRGQDFRRVTGHGAVKSISSETTFNKDIAAMDELAPILRSLSERVSERLKKKEIAGLTIILKLKTTDFKIRTRNRRLPDPTRLADRIFTTGLELLRNETNGTKYRLIGIGVSDLCDSERADPPDLVDEPALKRAIAESAIDAVRDKFGRQAVETGYTFGKSGKARPQRDRDI